MDKRRNGNHKGFVDKSYHPLHKFTMPASHIVVTFTHESLAALCAALMDHVKRLNRLLEPSWPDAVLGRMANLKETSKGKAACQVEATSISSC